MEKNEPICCGKVMEGRPPIKCYRGWVKLFQCSVCEKLKQIPAEQGEQLRHYDVVLLPCINIYATTLAIFSANKKQPFPMVAASEYADTERKKTDKRIYTAEVANGKGKWGVYRGR